MSRLFITGYCDRPSVKAGETLNVYVHTSKRCQFEAQLVRLLHGDVHPGGPGFKELEVTANINGTHEGHPQRTQIGGYVDIPDPAGVLGGVNGLTLHAFIWATLPNHRQAIMSRWDERTQSGWALQIEDGYPTLVIGDGRGLTKRISSTRRLFNEVWYSIVAGFDANTGEFFLSQKVKLNRVNSRLGPVVPLDSECDISGQDAFTPGVTSVPIVLAGLTENVSDGRMWATATFNGKLDSPKVFKGRLNAVDIQCLHDGELPKQDTLLAHWDFSAEISPHGVPSDSVTDRSPSKLHGRCINHPDRGMTGWNWDGHEERFIHCPEQYGAIWFHNDSLDDARWRNPIQLTVPQLRSGVYAVRLRHGAHEDHVPFIVSPPVGAAKSSILVLLPTISYLAYANSQDMQCAPTAQAIMGVISTLEDRDLELNENPGGYGLSTYDYHADGRGVQYSSWRRPVLSMRPRYRHEFGSLWQLPADLHLIDWLEAKGFQYDVATDHDLVEQGVSLLKRYKTLVTGTHPEYTTSGMLDAFEDYFAQGGRGMYLAANGFYWVTTVHPEKPWLMEVRKGESGTQAWKARPGEYFHATTGERGGLWRNRARAPQKIWGTGMGSHGLDISAGYLQLPDARDPRVAWIFDGVGSDEVIGDFGLVNGGAAGLEMDLIDPAIGTPPNVMLLASSHGHSENSVLVPEEQFFPHAGMNGIEHPLVRADIVYFTTPNGGAVFSTSSMTWSGSLSFNDYQNNVSQITANVLKKFAEDGCLEEIV